MGQTNPCLRLTGLLAAALILPVLAQPAPARAAAAAEAPSPAETEFWRSAERIGTPEAYRAFLAAFPKGLFAPLALAALDKAEAALAPAASASGPVLQVLPKRPQGVLGRAASLKPFGREAERSGVITFRLGDHFAGPGAIMVGRFGAKKQLVLPAGEWVVLAAVDSRSTQTVNYLSHQMRADPVDVSTVVFGQFAGSRLVSLLRFTFNGRVVTVPTWTDLAGCDLGAAERLRHERATVDRVREECLALRSVADPLAEAQADTEELRASLAELGAVVAGAGLVTTASFGDRGHGFLGVARIDWPGHWLGAAADDAAGWTAGGLAAQPLHRAYADALAVWGTAYRNPLRDGYWRDHAGPELSPGGRASGAPAPAGLGEFDPAAAARR